MSTKFIYRITNNINGHTYIGQHASKYSIEDIEKDKYMGSGLIIIKAFKTYGKDNFSRTILYFADSQEDLDQTEIEMIAIERLVGKAEYNIANGGSGGNFGMKCSDETRRRISSSLKGRIGPKHSEETRAKISAANKGKKKGIKLSDYTREKMSVSKKGHKPWNKGKTPSEETKEKISKANKGKTLSKEHREKISAANRIRAVSEETKSKISAAKKGKKPKPFSEERKRNMSKAGLGHKVSNETRAKISETLKNKRLDKN